MAFRYSALSEEEGLSFASALAASGVVTGYMHGEVGEDEDEAYWEDGEEDGEEEDDEDEDEDEEDEDEGEEASSSWGTGWARCWGFARDRAERHEPSAAATASRGGAPCPPRPAQVADAGTPAPGPRRERDDR